jgi:hypothetical protein
VTELDEWLVEDAELELEPGEQGTLTLPTARSATPS